MDFSCSRTKSTMRLTSATNRNISKGNLHSSSYRPPPSQSSKSRPPQANETLSDHSIHMLPHQPFSSYIRSPTFVREEWLVYFSPSSPYPAHTIAGGWRGILYANLATIDPKASWEFFAQDGFDAGWLDGGTTRTAGLVWAAGQYPSFVFCFRFSK